MDSRNMQHQGGQPGMVAPQAKISPREILAKLFFRSRLMLVCIALVPLVAVALTLLVPPKYEVTTKLLIRYDEGPSFFSEMITSKIRIVSGKTNAEIIRSVDLCRAVAEELSLTSADIARPAYKILFARLFQPFAAFMGSGDKIDYTQLAHEFKKSVEARTIQKDRAELTVSDELIEVSITSPNRTKVARMSNLLCSKFIDEYYRSSEAEARRAYEYLTRQAEKAEDDIARLKQDAPEDRAAASGRSADEFSLRDAGDSEIASNPLVENLSNQIAIMSVELERLRNIYTDTAPEVVRAQAEIERARSLLTRNESLETAKAVVNMIRNKRRQAFMTLQLYRNRMIPISIVEEATEPKASAFGSISRYVLNAVLGLFVGIVLGVSLAMLLGAIDSRLYTSWDVEKESGLNVIGSIPVISKDDVELNDPQRLPLKEAAPALMQVLGKLDLVGSQMGKIILITSPTRQEGKTAVALQIACALARDKRTNVLLVDGNLNNAGLSMLLHVDTGEGLVEILRGEAHINDTIRTTMIENLSVIPAGTIANRLSLGFFKKTFREAVNSVRSSYDVIVIDASGVLMSPEANLFASEADAILMTIRAAATRQQPLQAAMQVLGEAGASSLGAILNCRTFPIPRCFYR